MSSFQDMYDRSINTNTDDIKNTFILKKSRKSFSDYARMYKIVLIGNSGVGKTCLLQRIMYGTFNTDNISSTVGIDFGFQYYTDFSNNNHNKNIRIKAQIWDTAGQERFAPSFMSWYRGAKAIVICFDVSEFKNNGQQQQPKEEEEPEEYKLLDNVFNRWLPILDQQKQESFQVFLVATKSSHLMQQHQTQIQKFVNQKIQKQQDKYKNVCQNIFWTDSKSNHGIEEAFLSVCQYVYTNDKQSRKKSRKNSKQNSKQNIKQNIKQNSKQNIILSSDDFKNPIKCHPKCF